MTAGRIPVAVAGATGVVGQQFLRLLRNHPWFVATEIVGSARSAGRKYGDVVGWVGTDDVPAEYANLTVRTPTDDLNSRIIFSALPSEGAGEIETGFAKRGHLVFSNSSALRHTPSIPLVIPEVNGDQLRRMLDQTYARVGGGIATNPNCVVAGLALALAPIQKRFGLDAVTVVTLQSISGAGLSAMQATLNYQHVIPFIPGEEDKIAAETNRILKTELRISVLTNRIPVPYGHTVACFLRTSDQADARSIARALTEFGVDRNSCMLPSAPAQSLVVAEQADRPNAKRDLATKGGMAVTVGGIRSDAAYDAKFTLLVHNLIRGAAGASLLNAELALAQGYCSGVQVPFSCLTNGVRKGAVSTSM